MQLCQMQLKEDERIVYKNNVILLSKVWRKYKRFPSLQVSKAIDGPTIILSKCAVCGDKKPKFIKKTRNKRLIK